MGAKEFGLIATPPASRRMPITTITAPSSHRSTVAGDAVAKHKAPIPNAKIAATYAFAWTRPGQTLLTIEGGRSPLRI
jgi:hypothetical protein